MLPDCEEVPREREREVQKEEREGKKWIATEFPFGEKEKDGGRVNAPMEKSRGMLPREWRERRYVFHFLRLKVISRITFKVEPTVWVVFNLAA